MVEWLERLDYGEESRRKVAELCSGNENEVKIWIRGHN